MNTYNIQEVERIYAIQHKIENLQKAKNTTFKDRIKNIKKIEAYLLDKNNQLRLKTALWNDLRKSEAEMLATEIAPVISSMHHIYKNLSDWMEDNYVDAPITLVGVNSRIKYEPKGHVLIIAPWNYPVQLVLNPLIHAIAAGNVVLIKPSEIAANTAMFLKEMIQNLFKEHEVAVIEGDIPITSKILEQKFNHIFFTGSPNVGKIVMRAAANHLTSVTLELGGKSPTIIDESTNIKKAAQKVAWGKCLNSGQTCIAPDYLLIQENKLNEFVQAFSQSIQSFYNSNNQGIKQSNDFGRIVDNKNFNRIKNLIDDATSKGAKIEVGGILDENDKFISPTLISNINDTMQIIHEEIFGPVLPIITFKTLEEAIAIINDKPKPLAFYIMSNSNKNIQYILNNTSAGGVVINDLMLTTINPNMPFGGINNSGIGKSNGKHSFIEFSNEKAVLVRNWGTFKMIYPPYNIRIFNWLVKIAKF
jgi:aldehyde dehydrogenase (NAD+)